MACLELVSGFVSCGNACGSLRILRLEGKGQVIAYTRGIKQIEASISEVIHSSELAKTNARVIKAKFLKISGTIVRLEDR